MRSRYVLGFTAVMSLLPATAGAWDTAVDPAAEWKSIYLVRVPTNEHTSLSDVMLKRMGAGIIATGAQSDNMLTVTDLNASEFRRGVLVNEVFGDDPQTTLEERSLPSPAHFSGVPDYSWTVYDWINKNSLCPSVPENAQFFLGENVCHVYLGWLGAINSTHFGSQADLMYDHFHLVALSLAARAQNMRNAIAQDPDASMEFADFSKEADLEALAYEAYAQHFLQDRWSSGHMWERWNAGDYALLPEKDLPPNAVVGALSGIIHGAQALLDEPDPLCSPQIDSSGVTPIEWSHPDLGIFPGVGDYRWPEILEGDGQGNFFSSGSYQVFVQYEQMLECGMRGWSEVIRGLGANADGTFGAWSIPLNRTAPTGSPLATDCHEIWATNRSMSIGWGSATTLLSTIARQVVITLGVALSPRIRLDTVRMSFDLGAASFFDPAGTDMAQGGLGNLDTIAPGNAYLALPGYAEPRNMTTLPADATPTGRDARSVMGFFNRAHADHWCDPATFEQVIRPLRGSPLPEEQEVCLYLADRFFRGTPPNYTRFVEKRIGVSELPVCHFFGGQEGATDTNDLVPYYIHPGYLESVGATRAAGPASSDPAYLESLANWCNAIPVMDVDGTDLVARAEIDAMQTMVQFGITGYNFGRQPGRIDIHFEAATPSDVMATIDTWAEEAIAVSIPVDSLPTPLDGLRGTITLTRMDGVSTVGERFVLFGGPPVVLTAVTPDHYMPGQYDISIAGSGFPQDLSEGNFRIYLEGANYSDRYTTISGSEMDVDGNVIRIVVRNSIIAKVGTWDLYAEVGPLGSGDVSNRLQVTVETDCMPYGGGQLCRLPMSGLNGQPGGVNGDSACAAMDLTCVEIPLPATPAESCLLFHPTAQVTSDANGSRQAAYCNGEDSPPCKQDLNTCHHCPACNLNYSCTTTARPDVAEIFALCQ